MTQIRMFMAYLLLVTINSADAQDRYYDAPNHLWDTMSKLEEAYEFISYTGQPSESYKQHVIANHISVYAPDSYAHIADRIVAAYQHGGQILENIWQVDSFEDVIVFLVADIKENSNAQAHTTEVFHGSSIFADSSLVINIEFDRDYIESTFLHEYAHALQRMGGAAPRFFSDYENTQRWYTEGSVQHAGLLTGIPDDWIDKEHLYQDSNGRGRFSQAYKGADGKSLIERKELASYFWYYYFMKVHSGSREQYSNAIISYRENDFSHKDMSWFDFRDNWHDFALSHLNLPGNKTDIRDTIDENFKLVTSSARDQAEVVLLPEPFGDEVKLKVLSQKYFSVGGLSDANDYVIFSLPDKEIPEGVEISAVLSRTDTSQETWEVVPIKESNLGEHWAIRFPINGEAKLEGDSNIPYNDIIFVVSNYSDTDEKEFNMVITDHLREKYEGRGVELKNGDKYLMTGSSILGVPRTGDGYRLVIKDDEIHTRTLEGWFQSDPPIQLDPENDKDGVSNAKVLSYANKNAVFRGDVYFKYIGIRPEKVEEIGNRKVESGKLIVNRQRKENFYDTPNLFKISLNEEELSIMFLGDLKAVAAFTKVIEDTVTTKYERNTYGGNRTQLFQQTMALDTRAYNQDYEIHYERGFDDLGNYLKIRLAETMWFVLRDTQLAGFKKTAN
ncbi:MAG: hypothetical protein P8J68_05565 [Arenicellaceae bacterium]|nr:hypothetical protein [Arenicellaceae bacterium]